MRRWENVPGTQHMVLVDAGNGAVGERAAEAKAPKGPTRKELVAEAEALGLTVPTKAKVDEIAELIEAAKADKALAFDRGAALVEAKELGLDVDPDVSDDDLVEALAEAKAPTE